MTNLHLHEPFSIHIYLSLICLKQIIHLHDVHLHDDVNAKETFNNVFRKNIGNSTTYAQELKDFVESQRPFLTPPKLTTSNCSHMNGGI
jgi:hypothetical protein